MNQDILEAKWEQLQGQVKQHWARLTDNDLQRIAGKREALAGELQERYAYTRRQAEQEIDAFVSDVESSVDDARTRIEDRVQEAQERIEEGVDSAKATAEERAASYNQQMRESAPEEMEYVVEEYPWLAILGAFLAGVLIGVMLNPSS